MKKVVLEFEIQRGIINTSDLEEEVQEIHNRCLDLIKQEKHESAAQYLLPKLTFEWSWMNGDGDPSEFFDVADDIFYECTDTNTELKVGEEDGALILSAACKFTVNGNDDLTADDLQEWLDENSMYTCGYVAADWSYTSSDGDNVQVVSVDGKSA